MATILPTQLLPMVLARSADVPSGAAAVEVAPPRPEGEALPPAADPPAAAPLESMPAVRFQQPVEECRRFSPANDALPKIALAGILRSYESRHDLASVEAFLRASWRRRWTMATPTLARLNQVRTRLAGRTPETSDLLLARDQYLRIIDGICLEPPADWLFESLRRAAPLSKGAIRTFWSLNPLAQIGAYEVARALPPRHKRNIGRFLINRTIETFPDVTINGILETAALLADLGVRGFERAFIVNEFKAGLFDDKFLSSVNDPARIPSLFAEYQEALRVAAHSAVTGVAHDEELDIDWSRLTPEERRIIRRRIEPGLTSDFRVQRHAHVDILFRKEGGGRRLIEVKSAQAWLDLSADKFERELLQVFRHALLARIHGLEGVEYVFQAPRVSKRLPTKVKEILELTGTSYVLTIRRKGHPDDVTEWGMKRLGGDLTLPTERRYPFFP